MAKPNLTDHDISILAKIKDPEATTNPRVKVDSTLQSDPNVTGDEYESAKTLELDAIRKVAKKDKFGLPLEPSAEDTEILLRYLSALVERYPKYASARNNRVQAIRTIHGDDLLIAPKSSGGDQSDVIKRKEAAGLALDDLATGIRLLTASSMEMPISPRSAQTLANLHTQKATILNITSKLLSKSPPNSTTSLIIPVIERSNNGTEAELKTANDFADQVHLEFQLGAWYGNELAEKMVTATNPMAKLCGEIVSGAMRKEIEGLSGGT
ncbi:hypothetical protein BJ878DRAFT_540619 [Calycina marina]|uniref:Uncharacterized protein n=1 Tax=Calycina marina TaxID=1763456 RepID=A0A9P8CGD6_9HELO|nr:hypothetical protein BJ878DRAFT_540619 [Calycina marina]